MNELTSKRILSYILRPAVRYCLRHALHIQDLLEAAKVTFTEEAVREIEQTGAKVNKSRLSIITGLQRREVERIHLSSELKLEPQGLFSRVIGHWQLHPLFSNVSEVSIAPGVSDGLGVSQGPRTARPLTFQGIGSEFSQLVCSISKDINPGAVLFELERRNAVTRSDGYLHLNAGVFSIDTIHSTEDLEGAFELLASDMVDLSQAVEQNVLLATHPAVDNADGSASQSRTLQAKNLHGRTEFDNIPKHKETEVRTWLMAEGSKFHKRVRDYLARFDRDLNPSNQSTKSRNVDEKTSAIRVSVGAFSYIENLQEDLHKRVK